MRIASDIAALCAAALLVGLLGTALTWWETSALFDLAGNSRQVVKMGTGYLAGPILILVALPLTFGIPGQVARKQWFTERLLLAAALWLVGLVILIARVSDLDGYDLGAGTFVTAGLILVGLLATLAMWPTDLRVVKINAAGQIREPTRGAVTPDGGS